jgi:polyhydroxybutyrate depolymerase
MRAAVRLSTLLLSTFTLMCSSPADPGGDVGGAGTANNMASGNSAGTAGSGTVLPIGGSASGGGNTSAPSAGSTAASGTDAGGTGTSTAGSGSSGAAGSASTSPAGPTAGCMAPDPGDEPQKWLEHDINVANLPADQQDKFGARRYFVRLPVAYDHTKKYPLVFWGPGCGASNVEGTPMMDQVKNDAIHVFLLQKDGCFSTGSYPSPEVPYFTQALNEVQARYCTDSGKVFVSGYSSGAWMSNVIACAMGDRVRGIGTAAGGLQKSIIDGYKCNAPAAGIFYSGQNDTENPADKKDASGFQIGVIGARDRLITSNGCDANASESYAGNDICKIWKTGCPNNPVLFCVGPGDGHGKGDGKFNVSNKLFWDIWSTLP